MYLFCHHLLFHFPQLLQKSFRAEFDNFAWQENVELLQKWQQGKTGYPIVDAGMRELNTTGFMHNRVRMIVASFLVKHLLIDWRWGEAYFAEKLLDFDFAANNGGWQWAAGCGVDAAPYFRIFNPYLQTLKFDPTFAYIKKWVPELRDVPAEKLMDAPPPGVRLVKNYPPPVVDHSAARDITLELFKSSLS